MQSALSESIINGAGNVSVNSTLYANAAIEKVFIKNINNMNVNSFAVWSSQFEANQEPAQRPIDTLLIGDQNFLIFQSLNQYEKLKVSDYIDGVKRILNLSNFM